MTPWWTAAVGAAVTGLLAWAAQAWAKRGKSPDTLTALNGAAMGMVTQLVSRVERLELVDDWRATVARIDGDHIDVLEQHIWQRKDPPPPVRPAYPPRPA